MPKQASSVKEVIYLQAEDYFDSVLNAIEQAQQQIDMEVYIFELDLIGRKIIEALCRAAQRGVRVRLSADGVGVDPEFANSIGVLTASGGQVRIHRPLPWHFKLWAFAPTHGKGLQKFWYLLSYINQRNHRKLLIIDAQQVWLGSINISQKHLSVERGGQNWRDTAIELSGLDTIAAQTAFDLNWYKWRRKQRRRLAKDLLRSPFLFNFNWLLRVRVRRLILRKLDAASQRIWITNAYFVPDNKLLKALLQASHRGLDVRLLLPSKSDVFFMAWASSYFYERLLNAGAKIYEYQAGFLHAKTLLIDDWATIGSSNFNRRSLQHDLEVDYIVQNATSVQQLEASFLADLEHSEELHQNDLKSKKRWQRLLGGLLLMLFGYWV